MTRQEWTKEEIEILGRMYPDSKVSLKELFQALPRRTKWGINEKACRLGVRGPNVRKGQHSEGLWSKEEVEKLKQLWDDSSTHIEDILRALPKRSWWAILHKADRLGLWRRWSPLQETKLVKGEATQSEIGFIAGMIEGEGTLSMDGDGRPIIRICNTKLELLKYIQSIAGGSIYVRSLGSRGNRNPVYDLQIYGVSTVLETLRRLEPLFISGQKKKLCSLILEYCKNRLSYPKGSSLEGKDLIINQIRDLNRRVIKRPLSQWSKPELWSPSGSGNGLHH